MNGSAPYGIESFRQWSDDVIALGCPRGRFGISAILALSLRAPAQTPPVWRLAEETVIGRSPSAPSMTSVDALIVGPDLSTYVLIYGRQDVVVYDRNGVFVRTIGRPGYGSGEFVRPDRLGWIGDTLWVQERWTFSLFSRSGRFYRSFDGRVNPRPSGSFPTTLGLLGDGTILSSFYLGRAPLAREDIAPRISFVRTDLVGVIRDTLASFANVFVGMPHVGIRYGSQVPHRPVYAVAADGSRVIIADNRPALDSATATYALTTWFAGGKKSTRQHSYAPVDETVFTHSMNPGSTSPTSSAALGLGPVKRFLPPFLRIVAGRDGTIWGNTWERQNSWLVRDADRLVLGRVDLAEHDYLLEADRNAVWVSRRPGEGRSLVRIRLAKPSPSQPQR
jgi:hypothetical protein